MSIKEIRKMLPEKMNGYDYYLQKEGQPEAFAYNKALDDSASSLAKREVVEVELAKCLLYSECHMRWYKINGEKQEVWIEQAKTILKDYIIFKKGV